MEMTKSAVLLTTAAEGTRRHATKLATRLKASAPPAWLGTMLIPVPLLLLLCREYMCTESA